MQPKLEIISNGQVLRILDEAFQLLKICGVKVESARARHLLADSGAMIDETSAVARIPENLIRCALETVPRQFYLHNRFGEPTVDYSGDNVHFDPGSSSVHILDPISWEHRPASASDLEKLVKVAEVLSQYDAQSTAVVCNDVPKPIGDLYRLYIVLQYSIKPIVTGAFSIKTLQYMIEMLAIFAGDRQALAQKPQAIFDVCPSPPLIWSEFGAENLIELAHASVPAQIVSMPLAGAAAPVTLLGSVVQHAAESLSGITIHQLANPGAPIVWGGAPAIFDMRRGTTPMGAIETAMLDICYAQVGKSLGLPTHAYLGASDAKIVDAQAGFESGMTTIIGALAGINMISGAGMLDFLACQSIEKLVIDAEIIAMTKHLLQGVKERTKSLALEFYDGFNFKSDFLKQRITRDLFSTEQYIPSDVTDRDSIRGWQDSGRLDTFSRARKRVDLLLRQYSPPMIPTEQIEELHKMVKWIAEESGTIWSPEIG